MQRGRTGLMSHANMYEYYICPTYLKKNIFSYFYRIFLQQVYSLVLLSAKFYIFVENKMVAGNKKIQQIISYGEGNNSVIVSKSFETLWDLVS